MSSILSDRFAESMLRLSSSAEPRMATNSAPARSGESFSGILADLERKDIPANDSKVLAAPQPAEPAAEAPTPVLTNLDVPTEPQPRGRLAPEAFRPDSSPANAAEPTAPEPSTGVKTPATAVNSLAPEPRLPALEAPTVSRAPAMPTVIASRPPSAPQVIHARRLPTGYQPAALAAATPKEPFVFGNRSGFSTEQLKEMVMTAGRFHGIDPALSLAVADAESSFRPEAVSSDGHASKGLFQLLDSTGEELMSLSGLSGPYDPFDPGMNAYLGVGYLRQLMQIFSTPTNLGPATTVPAKSSEELEKLAVAAFNAGQGRVAQAQERVLALGGDPADFSHVEPHLPASTREYVRRVLENKTMYASIERSTETV